MPVNKRSTPSRARTAALKPLDPQVAFDELVESECVESIAIDMVQLILNKGANILYTHYIQSLAEDRTAQDTIKSIVDVVEFTLAGHDQGQVLAYEESERLRARSKVGLQLMNVEPSEEVEPDNLPEPMWTAELEPIPCEIDRWASGMVPVQIRKKEIKPIITSNAQVRDSDTSSRYSRMSKRSHMSRSSRRSKMSRRSVMGRKGRLDNSKIYNDDNPKSFQLEVVKTKEQQDHERLRVVELKKMEQKRRAHERKMKIKESEEKQRQRYESLKAELSGKAYTFDEAGEVVMVQPPNAKNLPHFGNTPRVRMVGKDEDEDGLPTRSRGTKQKKKKSEAKKKKFKVKVSTGSFVDLGSVQPPLSETLVLVQGVRLRHGRTVKGGDRDELPSEPEKMTWAQYNKMLVGSRAQSADPTTREQRVLTPSDQPNVEAGDIRVQQAEAAAAKLRQEQALKDAEEEKRRIDEAMKLAEVEDRPPTAEEAVEEEVDDYADDFNTILMKDPSWGQQPDTPKREIRPIPENPKRHRSPHKRLPRERPYISEPLSPLKAALNRLDPDLPNRSLLSSGPGQQFYNTLSTSRSQLMPQDDILTPRPQDRAKGFFPELAQPSKVQATDKAKYYFERRQ